jgi:death on curing protein
VGAVVYFLSLDDALAVHRRVIEEFGGDGGLRDRGFLRSAVAMPRASFGGQDLHADLFEKAAAYFYHHCANHPFVDGNKRVAVAVAELFLLLNQHELIAADESVEDLAMGTAEGRYAKAQVVEFFARHVERIRGGAA